MAWFERSTWAGLDEKRMKRLQNSDGDGMNRVRVVGPWGPRRTNLTRGEMCGRGNAFSPWVAGPNLGRLCHPSLCCLAMPADAVCWPWW